MGARISCTTTTRHAGGELTDKCTESVYVTSYTQKIATHLFLEDGNYWSVFACSDGPDRIDLFKLIADGDEKVYAKLHDRFKKVSKVENLGRAALGRSLCRITQFSSERLIYEFFRLDLRCQEGLQRTFVELGCGRGLVCAAALVHAPCLTRVIGYDIDAREIEWARHKIALAVNETNEEDVPTKVRVTFSTANALEFCAARDIPRPYPSPVGEPNALFSNESVWIYAFWFDWGVDTRREIARHLLLHDYNHWNVFACSRGPKDRMNLFELVAEGDESIEKTLRERFREVQPPIDVALAGSGQHHKIYFYVKK